MPVHFDPLRLVVLAFLNPSDSMMFLRVAYDECPTDHNQGWVHMPHGFFGKIYHQAQGNLPSELIDTLYINVTNVYSAIYAYRRLIFDALLFVPENLTTLEPSR